MFRRKKYSLVLMDMHMPVADGMETTQMIIEYEKKNGLEHTPVVALTAKASPDDKYLIKNSGLDGYLTKPIEIEKLESVFDRYLKRYYITDAVDSEDINDENNGFDYSTQAAAAELKIPENVLINIAGEFLNDAKGELNTLRTAIENLSFEDIYLHAHKLKGAAANLRLEKLGGFFYEIEENAYSGNKEFDYYKAVDNIENELAAVKKNIFTGSR